jgi:hypothetical protein
MYVAERAGRAELSWWCGGRLRAGRGLGGRAGFDRAGSGLAGFGLAGLTPGRGGVPPSGRPARG